MHLSEKSRDNPRFAAHAAGVQGSPVVRKIVPGEAERYRGLRLAALQESPASFTATWEEESALPSTAWAARADSSVTGTSVIVVADTGTELVGLAVGIPWEGRARVVSVWVAPEWRSRGVARRLIESVCDWAAASGFREAQIETTMTNPGPSALYERLGFTPVDETPPPDCGAVMVRSL